MVVLIVDDEEPQRRIISTILKSEGIETLEASSAEDAIDVINRYMPEVVLTDLKLQGIDGIELMEMVKKSFSDKDFREPSFIILTAFGTIKSAVDAIKKGAFDYLTKPVDRDMLLISIKRALEREKLSRENIELKKTLFEKFNIEEIVGRSEKIQKALYMAKKVSTTSSTVLILGETGTGKELLARAIHYNSPRRRGPFMAINCASIPETLIESELFGYEPGAFTGATTRKKGLFELADGGTLFLDEVADLPLITQAKLLRVLQEKEIMRLGGQKPQKIDVRIITATNKDIEGEIKKGNFREDLYFRLRVITIELPPLRERKEDIPGLVNYFIKKYTYEFGKRINGIEPSAIKLLEEYHWPGNIRQLQSIIERAVILCDDNMIKKSHIIDELRTYSFSDLSEIDIPPGGINLEELEKKLLKKAMEHSNGVISKAARLLGLSYKAFWYRWEKLLEEENKASGKLT